jgi:hypothetical protein
MKRRREIDAAVRRGELSGSCHACVKSCRHDHRGSVFRAVKLRKKHWAIATGVIASAYVACVGVALHGSIAQLRGYSAALTTRSAPADGAPRVESARGARRSRDVEPHPDLVADVAARGARDSGRGPPDSAQRPPPLRDLVPGDPKIDPPDEDASTLRERVLLDLSARPDFAELLSDPDPDVRKAALDFVEEH